MFPVYYFSPLYPYLTIPSVLSPTATGIYVWGFKFPNPNNPSVLGRFIPYYVGEAFLTPIFTRLKCHYKFDQSYNVFKPQYLTTYFNYLQPDTIVRHMSPADYLNYLNYFAYLNTGNILSGAFGNFGNPFNQLPQKKHLPNVASAIQYYKDHFFACWILLPVPSIGTSSPIGTGSSIGTSSPIGTGTTIDIGSIISSLERHINCHLPHPPIGRENAEHNSLFDINEEALGEDRFLI